MSNKNDKILLLVAQEIAKKKYEEENGAESWEDADKYEREDWVFAELDKLKKEIENMAQMRDAKGRFISSKAIKEATVTNNNTNSNNEKEIDTMMNKKMSAKEERMNKLAQAGVNTNGFFNLNLQIPFGAEVILKVNGKEMVMPVFADGSETAFADARTVGQVGNGLAGQFVDICNMANDVIAQSIIENGYVKNSKIFRRFILAHTMKMLNYVSWSNPNKTGWEAAMKDCYSYNYQFEMLLEEIRVISILQKEDTEAFEERIHFFNGDVVVATLYDYKRRLEKYINKQLREKPRTYRGQSYAKLARYGNVLVTDLNEKVYKVIQKHINKIENAVADRNYGNIYTELKAFMNKAYNKLPAETTKCATWKDAFKGSGAYYSLLNLVRFHNVVIEDYDNKYESEIILHELLDGEYKNEVWRFHQLLVDTIEYNNFDLRRSIAEGSMAPNTRSMAAERIAKSYNR